MDTNTLFLLLPSSTPPSSPDTEEEEETRAHAGEKVENERVEEGYVAPMIGGENSLRTGQLFII
jgi:hypothetical protein